MAEYQVYFDTREGEKRYLTDFGDDEPIEQVLKDIIVELTERGHIMRGFATGELKVIWGGLEGRELDLSRTLPEQHVRPNDVLRVLIESYEGGGSIRADRVETEWTLLNRVAAVNPQYVEILNRSRSPVEDEFHVRLLRSPGVERVDRGVPVIRDVHTLRLSFPRFYPEVPSVCHVKEPLFHPNVKAENGFVCLWEQSNLRDTVIQALARTQAMAAFRMLNLGHNGDHIMNENAATWYRSVAVPQGLVPLTGDELMVYEIRNGEMTWLEPGRRLNSSMRTRRPA